MAERRQSAGVQNRSMRGHYAQRKNICPGAGVRQALLGPQQINKLPGAVGR